VVDQPRCCLWTDGQSERSVGFRVDVLIHYFLGIANRV
jgi:hypothetical protein